MNCERAITSQLLADYQPDDAPATMKTSTKALLLSALVFPGAGHFVLKLPGRALALLAVAALSGAHYLRLAVQQALAIADGIERGAIALDAAAIEQAIRQTHAQSMTVAGYVFVACWLVGIVDAARVGQRLDADAPPPAGR